MVKQHSMEQKNIYDVIIVGGSYSGLSAGLALGRSLRNVLIIDSGNPCNKYTLHAQNFITNDGKSPQAIRDVAREEMLKYTTTEFINGLVTGIKPLENIFEVVTDSDTIFTTRKIILATGLTDTIPKIEGFAQCWGVSILHCPYCHGYEAKGKKTGILGNGDMGFELAKTISHWTDSLTLYTNGTSTLSPEEVLKLNKHNVIVVENTIDYFEHVDGNLKMIHFNDTPADDVEVIYTQLPFMQQCSIPETLGLEMTDKGFIYVSKCMETSQPGIYAAGDCLSLFRSVAHAVASGNKVGALINKCLIDEDF